MDLDKKQDEATEVLRNKIEKLIKHYILHDMTLDPMMIDEESAAEIAYDATDKAMDEISVKTGGLY